MNKKTPVLGALLLLFISGCATMPTVKPDNNSTLVVTQHVRPIESRAYTGNQGAIIFSINRIEERELKSVIDRLIRIFAENELPVDIAVTAPRSSQDVDNLHFLVPYSDNGLIDINLDGSDVSWLDNDTPNIENASATLKSQISAEISFVKGVFGSAPVSCLFPYEMYNEHNYQVLEETGIKIISSKEAGNFTSSRQPLTWSGKVDNKGLYRLPVIAEVIYPTIDPLTEATTSSANYVNKKILDNISKSIKGAGVAVISIQPRDFTASDGKIDNAKIQQLSDLIKQSTTYGQVITFSGWNKYASRYIGVATTSRIVSGYKGGHAVIFRLDDVSKDWHEEVDKALIEIFKANGIPLDCGVISNASGTDSYDLPWLKKYYDEGAVGINVHGFDWTYYQLDTVKSGLTYEQIKYKLQKARDTYLDYFGTLPVTITAPTDFYDKNGYQAIEDAGFKIFSTHITVEPHPSNIPVDFDGKKDPNGMYRLPTASDVCTWENEKFTGPFDVSDLMGITDYCKYYDPAFKTGGVNDFAYRVCSEITSLNVAVISLHPSAFSENGKINQERLKKVDTIVKWVKTFSTVMTFEQWYNYTISNN